MIYAALLGVKGYRGKVLAIDVQTFKQVEADLGLPAPLADGPRINIYKLPGGRRVMLSFVVLT